MAAPLSVAEARERFDQAQADLQVAMLVETFGLAKARAIIAAVALERGLFDEAGEENPAT